MTLRARVRPLTENINLSLSGAGGWVGSMSHLRLPSGRLASRPRQVSEEEGGFGRGIWEDLPGGGGGGGGHVRDDPLMNWPSEDLAKLFSVRP